jgi:hypothetical protein
MHVERKASAPLSDRWPPYLYCETVTLAGELQTDWPLTLPQTATITEFPGRLVGRIRSTCWTPVNPGAGPA